MADPDFAPFMAMIAGPSATMRHETLALTLDRPSTHPAQMRRTDRLFELIQILREPLTLPPLPLTRDEVQAMTLRLQLVNLGPILR
jgi:hypothetical protein